MACWHRLLAKEHYSVEWTPPTNLPYNIMRLIGFPHEVAQYGHFCFAIA